METPIYGEIVIGCAGNGASNPATIFRAPDHAGAERIAAEIARAVDEAGGPEEVIERLAAEPRRFGITGEVDRGPDDMDHALTLFFARTDDPVPRAVHHVTRGDTDEADWAIRYSGTFGGFRRYVNGLLHERGDADLVYVPSPREGEHARVHALVDRVRDWFRPADAAGQDEAPGMGAPR